MVMVKIASEFQLVIQFSSIQYRHLHAPTYKINDRVGAHDEQNLNDNIQHMP